MFTLQAVLNDYKIYDGAGATYNGSDIVFRSNAEYRKFIRVDVDSAPVDPANYTAESGFYKSYS